MNFIICLIVAVVLLTCVFLVKNECVFRARMKAIRYIYEQDDFLSLGTKLLRGENCYNAQVFHPLKWTYSHMFPELVRRGLK